MTSNDRLSLNPITSISGAWDLIKDNYWLFCGVTSLMLVVACCLPAGGLLVPFVTAGVYAMAFRGMRLEPYDFSTAMGQGYKGKSWRIFFAAIVAGLPWIPLTVGAQFSDRLENAPESAMYTILIVSLVLFVIALLWGITCTFWIALIVDRDLSFGDAFLESARASWMNSPGLILLNIVNAMLLTAGALLLCVGALFVYPIVLVSYAIAYRQIFPDTSPPIYQNEPPPPHAYQGSFGQGL